MIADEKFNKAEAIDFYEKFFNIDDLKDNIFMYENKEAIYHLLNLSLGRESLVIGEDQILGQLTDALVLAQELKSAKKYLNYIFRQVINFSKKIKTESEITKKPISTAYIGLKDIDEKLNIKDKKALVIGLGKMGLLSLNYLIDYGAKISVSNWTYENSLKIKEKYPFIDIVKFDQIKDYLDEFDLLISATKSPHTLIKKDFFKNRKKDLYILDLSLPRDVDSRVGLLENIYLYNIDKLKVIADKNLKERKEILDSYDNDIVNKTCEIYKKINEPDFSNLLNEISIKCEQTSEFTLSYLDRKLDIDHSQRIKLEKIIRSALNKVSRDPILKIKNSSMPEEKKKFLIEALEEVYKL